ncbi:MAG TPA: cyclic nucleotide-binding domain-containing protein [Burkholderiaceae bacterium]|nr:cyclic nucleotide-binding domain-containing protein [Burkholderiaceae bacterium]
MSEMLALSAHLPQQTFEVGSVVVREGDAAGAIWVLVSGALLVRKAGIEVNTITRPGAIVGEVSTLLGSAYSATVEASERSVLLHAADGQALLDSHPAITRLVAVGLAERLNFVTTYLADLKMQYADVPGLNMVSAVLRELSERQGERARPGSARDPNPDY